MNTLNGLYGFIAPSAGLSLNTALDAYDAIDAMAMANKQNQTQIDLANLQSRMQASQRRSGLLGSIIGGAATLGGAFLGNPAVGAAMLSDARTKRELRQLGMLGALPVYEFEYKWSKQKHVGVLAQDVAKRVPTAVKHLKNGYLAVNYDVLLEELAA